MVSGQCEAASGYPYPLFPISYFKYASITPSAGRGMMWLATNSPTCEAALAPASTAARTLPNVAADNGRDQSAADLNSLDDLHVRGLRHRVGRFDQRHEALRFDQSNGVLHCCVSLREIF